MLEADHAQTHVRLLVDFKASDLKVETPTLEVTRTSLLLGHAYGGTVQLFTLRCYCSLVAWHYLQCLPLDTAASAVALLTTSKYLFWTQSLRA